MIYIYGKERICLIFYVVKRSFLRFLGCVFFLLSWIEKEDDLQNQITTVATRSTTPKVNKNTQRYQDFLDKYKCKNYVLEFIYQLRYYSFLCFVFSLFTHTHTHTHTHNHEDSTTLRNHFFCVQTIRFINSLPKNLICSI